MRRLKSVHRQEGTYELDTIACVPYTADLREMKGRTLGVDIVLITNSAISEERVWRTETSFRRNLFHSNDMAKLRAETIITSLNAEL